MGNKRGKLSAEEKRYIEQMCDTLTVDQIAQKLKRTTASVLPYFKDYGKKKLVNVDAAIANQSPEVKAKFAIRQELLASYAWGRLKDEFEPDECLYFEEMYVKLMAQFEDDVLATEETQIFQACKLQILMSRNLEDRKKLRKDIGFFEELQKALTDKYPNPKLMSEEVMDQFRELETTLNQARSTEASKTNEWTKLEDANSALMKAMKATRDQRFERIEKQGVDFISIMKQFASTDFQEREMRQNELLKLATDKMYNKLGTPHTYEDGNQDNPILSCDTVNLGIEEETNANV